MGGRKESSSNYALDFVRYIEIAEKIQRYKREVVGMSSTELEGVCGRMFGYSERALKDEEYRSRKRLLESVRETFGEQEAGQIWADGCLFRGKEFLEANLSMLLSDASDFSVLRCQSYKKNLRKSGNAEMTPRELEREFHKECIAMAEANERKNRERRNLVKMMPMVAALG